MFGDELFAHRWNCPPFPVPRLPSRPFLFRSWDARGKAADAGGTVICLTCGVRASGAPVRARPATLRGAQRASIFNDTQIMAKMRSDAKSEPYKNTFAGRSLPTVNVFAKPFFSR